MPRARSIRRYDAGHALRSAQPARFIRPVDLTLLAALAQARLWDAPGGYGLPDLLRPSGEEAVALLLRLCETGRFLHGASPEAHLYWSEEFHEVRLAWSMRPAGSQRLAFAAVDVIAPPTPPLRYNFPLRESPTPDINHGKGRKHARIREHEGGTAAPSGERAV